MTKKPKPQVLRERIEKTSTSLDSEWQSHYAEVVKNVQSIKQLGQINLLDQAGAIQATEMLAVRIKELEVLKKQIRAVNTLVKDKRNQALNEIENLPWNEPEE